MMSVGAEPSLLTTPRLYLRTQDVYLDHRKMKNLNQDPLGVLWI